MRQREVPRWRRNRNAAPAAQPIMMSGRQARKYARQMAVYPPGVTPVTSTVSPAVPGSYMLRKSQGFRFRRHLVPFAWLGVMCVGLLAPVPVAVVAGLVAGVLIVAFCWHLSPFARHASWPAALLSALWIPLLSAQRWTAPWPPLLIGSWLAVAVPWLQHYRWRPTPAADPVSSDVELWNRHLAVRRLKDSWLTEKQALPNGRRWTVMLPPGELEPRQVMSSHALIAGVWDKPMTEVFPEPYPDGRQSRCHLTILDRDTLATVHEWDGTGFSRDGIAGIGRFADGSAAHWRLFVPRDGTRHGLIAGCMGSGKTTVLDLLILSALTCPFSVVPVVLDPQEGQSLPHWRGRIPYACGVEECMTMLRGLHAGMLSRSSVLASLEWADEDGHTVTGMPFYDPELAGLPMVMPILEEAPALLGDRQHGGEATWLVSDIAKRGRKTGMAAELVAQVPMIAELKDQAIRSMLVGGNVACLRTGDRVSAGAVGLDADPSILPRYFADKSATGGLGYLIGIDQRQAPFRADWPSAAHRRAVTEVPSLDDGFAEAMAAAMRREPARLRAVPSQVKPEPLPDDSDAPEGRKAVDAVWKVLSDDGGELERGAIINRAAKLATQEWGRPRPFGMRSVQDALNTLLADGRAVKPDNRHGIYRASNTGSSAANGGG